MHGRLGIFSMVTLCAFGTAIGAEATSPSAVIWANPSGSLLWRTVRETPVKVSIDWPQDAAKAVLTASIGGKELVRAVLTDRSVKVKSLAFAFPHAEGEESVIDLSLTFFDSSDVSLSGSSRAASVGLVRGVGRESFRLVPDGEQNGKWRKVKGSAVVPVYRDTSYVSFDGVRLSLPGTPGWTYLADVSPALHSLVLASGDGSVIAAPIVGTGGSIVIVR